MESEAKTPTNERKWQMETVSRLNELTEDGDTVTVGEITYRLRVKPDEWSDVREDGDWYGKVGEFHDYRSSSRGERPDGFTGNAEKLNLRSGWMWWEPPSDVARFTPAFTELRDALIEVLEYGYSIVVLEACRGRDAYGHLIVRRMTSISGVMPFTGAADVQDIVADLYSEIEGAV